MSRVQLINVSKQFGETFAVRDLNLDIASGEFVSIVGGSGCGKTTTLRMLAGFETPTTGEIRVDNKRVNDIPVQDRGVGIVFQSYALFPTMTVAQNVGFGLEMAGQAVAVRTPRILHMLELVQLASMADRYPWQLSGGQQQRVALARALALAPKVLLLDEPLSALDAKIRLSLRSEIRRIQQELGITTLYVTHDQEEALAIADRIVVMDKGVIQQAGTARAVYDHPENPFVASFVGVSNHFEGELISSTYARVGAQEWRVSLPETTSIENTTLKPGARVLITVRPERMTLLKGGAHSAAPEAPRIPEGHNMLEGLLGVRTFLGSSWRIEVLQGSTKVLVDMSREEEEKLEGLAMGALVRVHFRPEDAVCFVGG